MRGIRVVQSLELGVDHQLAGAVRASLDMSARRHVAEAREHLHDARQGGGLGLRMDGEAIGGGHGT